MSTKINVNVIAENFIGQANGVYTAFLETVEGLKQRPDLNVSVNGSWKNADCVHAHSIGMGYLLQTLRYKKKCIVTAHVVPDSFMGSLVFSEWWRPIAKWYLRLCFNRASLVIAVSPTVKVELEKIGVTTPIHVLCNAVNRSKFKPDFETRIALRTRYKLQQSDFVVVCVGQVQPRKGIYDFLETARKLPQVQFVWVGGRPFGRLTADYEKLSKAVENAPSNVLFTGIVDFNDMPGYYAMADVFFMPSYQENFAFATIEASSVRLPLVLRDNPEYPDTLFTHYLKGKTADDFAKVIHQLHTDQAYFSQWQTQSDSLASKYQLTAHVDQLVAFYKSRLK